MAAFFEMVQLIGRALALVFATYCVLEVVGRFVFVSRRPRIVFRAKRRKRR